MLSFTSKGERTTIRFDIPLKPITGRLSFSQLLQIVEDEEVENLVLDLSHTQIKESNLLVIFNSFSLHFDSIDLSHNYMEISNESLLRKILSLTTSIDLGMNSLFSTPDNKKTIVSALSMTNTVLRHLKLNSNRMSYGDFVDVANALSTNTTLKTLNASHNTISLNSFNNDFSLENTCIESIDLYNNSNITPLGSGAGKFGIELLKIPSLTSLNMGCCTLYTIGMNEMIDSIVRNTMLMDLRLNYNRVTYSECYPHISDLIRGNDTLRTLHIAPYGSRAQGGHTLIEPLSCNSTLTDLDLAHHRSDLLYSYTETTVKRNASLFSLLLGVCADFEFQSSTSSKEPTTHRTLKRSGLTVDFRTVKFQRFQ